MSEDAPTSREARKNEGLMALRHYRTLYSVALELSQVRMNPQVISDEELVLKDTRDALRSGLAFADEAIVPLLEISEKKSAGLPVTPAELDAAVASIKAGNARMKTSILEEGRNILKVLPADRREDREDVMLLMLGIQKLEAERPKESSKPLNGRNCAPK